MLRERFTVMFYPFYIAIDNSATSRIKNMQKFI